MVRVRPTGGAMTAEQYLVLDALADRYANGTLRITTRASMQFHGVLRENLKATIAEVNHALLTTMAACGDVVRQVMASPAPIRDTAHARVIADARMLADALHAAARAPTTRSSSTRSGSRAPARRRSRSTARPTCRGSSRSASPIWTRPAATTASTC